MYTLNTKGEFTYGNKKLLEMTGYKTEDWQNKPFHPIVYPEDLDIVIKKVQDRLSGKGTTEPYEIRISHSSGEILWVKINSESIYETDEKGNKKLAGMQSFVEDITKRKLAKEALKKSEVRFQNLLDSLNDVVWAATPDGSEQLYINSACEEIYGYSVWEFLEDSRLWADVVYPADKEIAVNAEQRMIVESKPVEVEYRIIHKDGDIRWVRDRKYPSFDKNSNLIQIGGVLSDVSEQKKAEEALRESEERYRNLVEEQSELICRYTSDWELTFVNEAYCRYFGKRCEELIGRSFMTLLPVEDQKKVAQEHHTLLSSDLKQVVHEHKVIDGKGEIRWQQWVNRAVYDRSGLLKEYQSVGRDITELKKAEAELKKSIKEKEVLLREVHHRVKNNFEIISSLLDMSSMHTENLETQNLLADARARIHTMALIHTQLYQSDRFDQIDMKIHIQELMNHLSHAYADIKKKISSMIESSGVYLSINQAVPCALVLNELIANAFKHAFIEKGQGTVQVSIKNSTEDTVLLKVKDDGVGISEGFDLNSSTGLGLKLVRHLVAQLKGEMHFNHDDGTEVCIDFKQIN
jgi:PAS domain S-box-containing protein